MRLHSLRAATCAANKQLLQMGLVILTWGNVSAFDPESGLMVIKPSGVPYEVMTPEDMVLVDLEGHVVEGKLKPSSDTDTHLELYRNFPSIGSVVHTHSQWATIWAQLGEPIPPLGTTHADDFGGEIPCTRALKPEEIKCDYEKNTGRVIFETLSGRELSRYSAVLVRGHGPFVWDATPALAVQKALVLEYVAKMAWYCKVAQPELLALDKQLLERHFTRKHGDTAYYGQH